MEVLGDEFTDGRKVQREDRVFFFFAGHGATRTFEDGRQVGFIVPVDADRENYYLHRHQHDAACARPPT